MWNLRGSDVSEVCLRVFVILLFVEEKCEKIGGGEIKKQVRYFVYDYKRIYLEE